MPMAGRTVPRTSPAGTLTTKIIRLVSVRTLTRMLNARPKKALVSPRVPQGRVGAGAEAAVVLMTGLLISHGGRNGDGRRGLEQGEQGGQQCGRVGDPAEDPALGA